LKSKTFSEIYFAVHTIQKVWENDFTFSKIDFKTEYEKKYLNGQKTNLLFHAGYATGEIPLTHLYNTSPNNITKETIIQRITFASKTVLRPCILTNFSLMNLFTFSLSMVLKGYYLKKS
jgi:hypothetical protein